MNPPQHAPDEIPFGLHHRLALTIEAKRVTVDELMDELGRSRNTILNYISGRTTPSKGDVNTWARLAQVSFFWLWKGEPDIRNRCFSDTPDLVLAAA